MLSNKHFLLLYASFISLMTFVFWFYGQETIGISVFIIIGSLWLYFYKDTFYAAVLLLNSLFMVKFNAWSFESVPIILYLVPVFFFIMVIVHIIKFKVRFTKGKLKYAGALMLLGFVLSSFNRSFDHPFYFFLIVIALFYTLIYLFFVNTIQAHHVQDFFLVFSLIGFMIALQVFAYYLTSEDIVVALSNKGLTAGWGISNVIATFFLFSLPMTAYLLTKHKHNIVFMLLGVTQVIALLLTYSRGGILAFLVLSIPLFIYTMLHVKKRYTTLYAVILLTALYVLTLIYPTETQVVIDRLVSMDLESNGRIVLYREAWGKFLSNPLFGSSFFARVNETSLRLVMYHNTFFQTLAALGLVGLLALLYQLFIQVKVALTLKTPLKAYALIILGMTFLHGMVENTYYMVHYMIVLFLFIAVIEAEEQ